MAERNRIFGTEMEYPISVRFAGSDNFSVLNVDDKLVRESCDPRIAKQARFLSNGARFYPDLNFAEYATPETQTLEDMLVRELAGERVVIDALIRFLERRPDIEAAEIHKRVIDDFGQTWGYHGNLLADRIRVPTLNAETAHLLGLHIASSQALLGSGAVQQDRSTGRYYYSFGQKVLDIGTDAGTGTINTTKSIINQRERSYADNVRYRRIHMTSLDPHISPWATKMSIGTLSLVLRAIEQDVPNSLHLAKHGRLHKVAKQNAQDIALKRLIRLTGRKDHTRTISALDLQQEIIKIVSDTEHTSEEAYILTEWQRAIDDLHVDPMKLADRSDAICKLRYIRSLNAKNGHDPDDMSTTIAHDLDLQYDKIFATGTSLNPRDNEQQIDGMLRSIPHRLRTTKMSAEMPNDATIEDARYNPPTDTRAFGRAAAIASGRCTHGVGWSYYTIDDKVIRVEDPYDPTVDERVRK